MVPFLVKVVKHLVQIGWLEARHAGFFKVGMILGIANHMRKQAKKENQAAC
jgi:hypothetical protein